MISPKPDTALEFYFNKSDAQSYAEYVSTLRKFLESKLLITKQFWNLDVWYINLIFHLQLVITNENWWKFRLTLDKYIFKVNNLQKNVKVTKNYPYLTEKLRPSKVVS